MEITKYIDPFSDIGFKAIFGREGQSEEILREFLNEVFRGQPMFDEIKEVKFINNERTKEHPENKTIIHDVLCTTDTGQRFIVEMQKGEQEQFLQRSIYYVSRGITDQAVRKPGESAWEYELLPVAGVFVTTFPIAGLTDKLLLHLGLADLESGELVARHVRLAFIQTSFFNKSEKECVTKFDKIIYTLKNMPTLTAIPFQETKNDIFARMDEAARYAALSPEERRIYDYELKKARDRAAELSTAERKGIAQGRAEGVAQGIAQGIAQGVAQGISDTARRMKEAGMDTELISKFTGLTPSEIDKL